MKTILILVDQLYNHGGIEKLVAIKANYWTEKFEYKVIIVSTEQNNRPPVYKLSTNVEFIDIDITYHRAISFFHPKNFKKIISNIKELKKVLISTTPDFILVASHIPMTYILPFMHTKAKIIKEFHYSKFNREKNKKEGIFSSIEKRYDYLVVLSPEEKTFYPSKNVKVIPNPVVALPKVVANINEKQNIAGAVLRFAPVKQIEKMVEAWELFYQKNLDWKLYLYGATDNEYYEKIFKLVAEKNLEQSIIFKGQTDNVITAFSEIKVLLMTSANECFPMVILEANSCGVPVVSFNSPTGPRNIITHNVDGLIVPLNDVPKFAEVLDHLVKDKIKMKTLSENAVTTANKYLIEDVMWMWKNLIFESND
ncbi:glycosyltransferase [Kaistella carnis]|uniref:glycosyltransferase n=1 Tax=Kaistella carnis TaxID=1241979 RepID=UPI0028AA05C1|nr:glycosyltransferase [Kaistella carnis]